MIPEQSDPPVTKVSGATMRAAVIDAPGASPRVGSWPAPAGGGGRTLVRVIAAAVNPLDLGIAAGVIPTFRHEEPFVPGVECVGTVVESDTHLVGSLVYAEARPTPATPGTMATVVAVPDAAVLAVRDGLDPLAAVAVGNAGVAAYIPVVELGRLRAGDTLVVLGATGAVGRIAVQIARAYGAGRVVAVGRDAAALASTRALGAHATVELVAGDDTDSLARRLAAAVGPGGADIVLDAVYGTALEAALHVCAPGARVVNVGNPSGATITLPAGLLRGRYISLIGFAGFRTDPSAKAAGLRWLWQAVESGALSIDIVAYPLDEIDRAWAAQALSPHAKNVVTCGTP